ncbi:MAG: prepilin peptidase [Acidobacteria bacterium]|nr:prepilin peptidase [Acidobacteriota bacterium]MBI3663138.1 prepilin peptidase [Acidobacteriota bacterium]
MTISFSSFPGLPPGVVLTMVFIFGLLIGSFLNVCIRRLPAEQPEERSIVHPRSHCPHCKAPIDWYDNIPLLSYLLLAGKCRSCKMPISALYPVVELITALLFLASAAVFGLTFIALKWTIFACLMIVLVFTDIIARILPDPITFGGLAAGLVLAFFSVPEDGAAAWLSRRLFDFPPPAPVLSLADTLFGAALGGGLLWLVGEVYFKMRGREGMGFGDVKMMTLVGAFLGPQRTFLTILVGSLLGSILGLLFILVRRKGADYELPFGSFLGIAALLVVFFGTPVLEWYLRISGIR